VAGNDAYSVKEDKTMTVKAPGVLGNDTDPDGDRLTASLFSPPKNGTLTLKTDGSITYKPKKDYNGTDRFTYKGSDGQGGTDTATVSIRVKPVRG
jgi:hypothetical protein